MIWVLAAILTLAYSGLSMMFGMDKTINKDAFGLMQATFVLFIKLPLDGLSAYLLAKWIIGFFRYPMNTLLIGSGNVWYGM